MIKIISEIVYVKKIIIFFIVKRIFFNNAKQTVFLIEKPLRYNLNKEKISKNKTKQIQIYQWI